MTQLKKIEGNKLEESVLSMEIKNLNVTSYDQYAISKPEFKSAPENLVMENAPTWANAYMQSETVKAKYHPQSRDGTPTHVNFDYTLIYLKLNEVKTQ